MIQPGLSLTLFCIAVITCHCFPCKPSNSRKRKLHIATCDNRVNSTTLDVFKITGKLLVSNGVRLENVCVGKEWTGFDVKLKHYLTYLQTLTTLNDGHEHYALLTDSDIFWSIKNINKLWTAFDCARENKLAMISSESNCYVGVACSQNTIDTYYNRTDYPSYSPFVNTGVIMGRVDVLVKMYVHVLDNQSSFLIKNHGVHRLNASFPRDYHFDDQFAITDYVHRVAPKDFATDYHQQLSAGFLFLSSTKKGPSVCVDRTGRIIRRCDIISQELEKEKSYYFDSDKCKVDRRVNENMTYNIEMKSLAPSPVLWHGNGRGKDLWISYAEKVLACLKHPMDLRARGFT